jgi:AcrR family transcriptional regulator
LVIEITYGWVKVRSTPSEELIQKERAQRREHILDIAETLFFKSGFARVTMEEIAQNVGLNKATIYNSFEDKDSLFFAIVLRKIRTLHSLYRSVVEEQISGREKSHRMGATFFAFARANPDYFCLLCTSGPERFRNSDNTLARAVREALGDELSLLRSVLEEGIRDGSIRNDLDPLKMAIFINVTSTSIVCLSPDWRNVLEAGGIAYDRFVADYLRFIGNAIDAPPPRQHASDPRDLPGERLSE